MKRVSILLYIDCIVALILNFYQLNLLKYWKKILCQIEEEEEEGQLSLISL